MDKIKTIFKRDLKTHKVIDELDVDCGFKVATATEKIDGTNVRVTVRNHIIVRVEKRRNPNKIQKKNGIIDPWYVDASLGSPEDKHIFNAVTSTDFSNIPDGEWSAEAYGENIQGNPLSIEGNKLFLFSILCELEKAFIFNVPYEYDELKKWLPRQDSKFGSGKIEGIVWHDFYDNMVKIKTKDF